MTASSKIFLREALVTEVARLKVSGKSVVFTNGCFDILHVGHARYLEAAREVGDVLIVGVNSDKSVRRLKGPLRPLVPEDERSEMLAHLDSVSYVCLFDEERPDALIDALKPNIHVKGGDYREEDLPEAEVVRRNGGRVLIMPLVEGKSTTNIIARILETHQKESVGTKEP
ncbi:MAG: D-glycero-beta-D-manno-heptose 1-phosphate adenylyltransferase [Chthonomonadales bacterium]